MPSQQPPVITLVPLIALITFFLMLQPISTDMYLASLPAIRDYFSTSMAVVQLTLTAYAIGFGVAQLFTGPLSDQYGRRPLLLAGLVVFGGSCVGIMFANSMSTFILGRLCQAVGCCTVVVVARAVIRDVYAPEQGARALARASSWMTIAILLGPIIGSYLQVAYGWRASFAVPACIAVTIFLLVWFDFRESNVHKNPYATQLAHLWQNYKTVMTHPVFCAYAFAGALSYGLLFIFLSGSSFALIRVLHVPTQWFGWCFAFGALGYLSGSLLCQRLIKKIGTARTLRLGTTLSLLVSLIFFGSVWAGLSHWSLLTGAMFGVMSSHGLNFPVAQAGSIAPFPKLAGTAAGLLGALTMVFAIITGSLVGSTQNGTLMPMALLSVVMGVLVFATTRILLARAQNWHDE